MATAANLQKGLMTKLLSVTALTARIGTRLYDLYNPGTGNTYPRVLCGIVYAQEPSENKLQQYFFRIQVHDSGRDVMDAVEIGYIISDALHNCGGFTATGWDVFNVLQAGSVNVIGVSDDISHVSVDFRVIAAEQ